MTKHLTMYSKVEVTPVFLDDNDCEMVYIKTYFLIQALFSEGFPFDQFNKISIVLNVRVCMHVMYSINLSFTFV